MSQRNLGTGTHLVKFSEMAVRGGKTVRSTDPGLLTTGWPVFCISLPVLSFLISGSAAGQLVDPLDAYPPRWALWSSDCQAQVIQHEHQSDSAAEGGRCESFTLSAGHGSEVILVYPIEPVRPIDELAASLSVKALSEGLRIGFRVRFPYLIDPATKRPAHVLIFGSTYQRVGGYQRLGVSDLTRPLKLKQISLRKEHGVDVDLQSPYVDAVVLNAYCGQGKNQVRLDQLRVDAMVPLVASETRGPDRKSSHTASESRDTSLTRVARITADDPQVPQHIRFNASRQPAFPPDRLTRILEHNGEPLSWVRTLGFDAVWLSRPATASVLSEAIAARMRIYAPAPSAPDEKLKPLLEPIVAWVVDGPGAMDRDHETDYVRHVQRLRDLPAVWQRPIVGNPVEHFRFYGGLLDAVLVDEPPRVRSLSSVDACRLRRSILMRLSGRPAAIGITSMPNSMGLSQTEVIANRIGSPKTAWFPWQSMWRQVADSLADAPGAILLRSSKSLASGSPMDQNRAMALSFVNRFVAGLEPWLARAVVDPQPIVVRDPQSDQPIYTGHRLACGPTTLLILTSSMSRGEHVLAGDGKTIEIDLPAADQSKLIWRLTHFSAQRLQPTTDSKTARLQIVSPDVVEVLAISDDVRQGASLGASMSRFLRQAALDRWQLADACREHSQRCWSRASAARLIQRPPPQDLLSVARNTLSDAEGLVRAGQHESSINLARRADAWCMKSDWMLQDALVSQTMIDSKSELLHQTNAVTGFVSSPPLITGNLETQIAWSPLLMAPTERTSATIGRSRESSAAGRSRTSWTSSLLADGGFERDGTLEREGWTFGRRQTQWAECEARRVPRGTFRGNGALFLRVAPRQADALPGGYEGTCLLVASPPIGLPAGSAVRIDAKVRTMGFSQPHQGVLMYDSVGTQELGVLVRDQPSWTPVTLFRQTTDTAPFQVLIEVIGGGEATIDDIEVRLWQPEPVPPKAMRPMTADR